MADRVPDAAEMLGERPFLFPAHTPNYPQSQGERPLQAPQMNDIGGLIGSLLDVSGWPAMLSPLPPSLRGGATLPQALVRGGLAGSAVSAGAGAGEDIQSGRNPLPSLLPNAGLGLLTGAGMGGLGFGGSRVLSNLRPRVPAPGPTVAVAGLNPTGPVNAAADVAAQRLRVVPPAGGPPLTPAAAEPAARTARPTGPTVEARPVRPEKLTITPPETARLEMMRDALGLSTRRVRTFEDVAGMAHELGADPGRLLREANSKRLTDSEVKALADLTASASKRISDLQGQLAKRPDLADELGPQMDSAEAMLNRAVERLWPGGTEAGRTVNAFRMIANRNLSPEYWLLRAKRELGDRPLSADVAAAIQDLTGKGDRLGLAVLVASLRKPAWQERAVTLWKAGLLTSPTTHLGNIFGNVTMSTLENVKDIPAAGIDRLVALGTGRRTLALGPENLPAQFAGIGRGLTRAAGIMRTGIDEPALLQKWDVPRMTNFGEGPMGKALTKFTRTVFNSLGAEDKVFLEQNMGRSMATWARAEALNDVRRGLVPPSMVAQRTARLMAEPSEEMRTLAMNEALYATFNRPNKLAEAATQAKGALGPTGRMGAELLMPFTRTPTNVGQAAYYDYTPASGLVSLMRLAKGGLKTAGEQRMFAQEMGRSLTGSGAIALGYYLGSRGMVNGEMPSDAAERKKWQAEQRQPFSILIGGKQRSLNRISPMGNLIGLGASLYENLHSGKSVPDALASTVASGGKQFLGQTFLKGLSGGLEAINDPQRSAERFMEQTAGSTVPAVVGRVAQAVDPYQRETRSVPAALASRVPFLSRTLPARISPVTGQPLRRDRGALGMGTLFDPFASTPMDTSLAARTVGSIGYAPGKPPQTLNLGRGQKVKLPPDAYQQYQRDIGQGRETAISRVGRMPHLETLDPDERQKRLRDAVEASDRRVRARWVSRYRAGSRAPDAAQMLGEAP